MRSYYFNVCRRLQSVSTDGFSHFVADQGAVTGITERLSLRQVSCGHSWCVCVQITVRQPKNKHVARMGEGRGVFRVSVGRPVGKRPLGRPRHRWEDNIKIDLREIGIDGAN